MPRPARQGIKILYAVSGRQFAMLPHTEAGISAISTSDLAILPNLVLDRVLIHVGICAHARPVEYEAAT